MYEFPYRLEIEANPQRNARDRVSFFLSFLSFFFFFVVVTYIKMHYCNDFGKIMEKKTLNYYFFFFR